MLELNKIHNMDCREGLKLLDDNSIDSIVTDPPYELGFMNKKWDKSGISYDVEMWKECFRVLKPGGHLLSFGGTRTYHRMVCAIEDAGFIIHPMIAWIFGTGFPKATDLSLQLDKQACRKELTDELGRKPTNEEFGRAWEEYRKVVGVKNNTYDGSIRNPDNHKSPAELSNIGEWGLSCTPHGLPLTAPATDVAKQWDGWHYGLQSLKPAIEPICMAQKPPEGRMTDNVLKWGTGAINIDECRVETDEIITNHSRSAGAAISKGKYGDSKAQETHQTAGQQLGRFPANVIHDGSEEVLAEFAKAGVSKSSGGKGEKSRGGLGKRIYGKFENKELASNAGGLGDTGTPSRYFKYCPWNKEDFAPFFYCAKASKKERGEGNNHPTVKPLSLIKYLITLITPPGGVSLDTFVGSGTHPWACIELGFDYIGFELEKEYCKIAERRIESSSEDSKSKNKNGDQITIWY